MTSAEIRQSFLDFFHEKKHTVVPSSSLMPDSPNLLFTNAGMNQFVPIFLAETKCPYNPGRATDTQKCIRAGGKHNDLDDVGFDTYHHTFFEMLGNWSFGDYFKKEAIEWAWELVVGRWKFPPERIYATVYCPYMNQEGWEEVWAKEMEEVAKLATDDEGRFIGSTDHIPAFHNAENAGQEPFRGIITQDTSDKESALVWWRHFVKAGLDPLIHIVPGNKKDNFWMMGDTGPCGPCSELHVDLTAAGDTKGSLVNKGDARCIEIWNLVFIQFNANPDGTLDDLPARHVDTGMGFERVTSIIQGTKNFSDFAHAKISNYETDIFRPIFDELEIMSGRKYGSTLPPADLSKITEQESTDIAFRVMADHIRTLSFSIADGIQPGNSDRNYVLRRILRRAVRYGRTLGFHEPFFFKLVDVLTRTMGDVFPELRARQTQIKEVLHMEEEAFNRTLDNGLQVFDDYVTGNRILTDRLYKRRSILARSIVESRGVSGLKNGDIATDEELMELVKQRPTTKEGVFDILKGWKQLSIPERHQVTGDIANHIAIHQRENPPRERIEGESAFELYDTYGFPLDLTEVMARERGLAVDHAGFEKLMQAQRERARAAQKKEVISVSSVEAPPTNFVGYDAEETSAKVLDVIGIKDKTAVILDNSVCYAEMGGQVGDTGLITHGAASWSITDTRKAGGTWLHFIDGSDIPQTGSEVTIVVDCERRAAIERHHTVTHLLHWALHEVVSRDATQKGSFVGTEKLTFDFNSAPLTSNQVRDIERIVNERIVENAAVSWQDFPYAEVKSHPDVMQFFGDKYGDQVRVVQVGGQVANLNGYSMELCGGTHVRATGEIGLFRILGEAAIAAGVRRIEAIAGMEAFTHATNDGQRLMQLAHQLNTPLGELEKRIEALLVQQKEMEKALKAASQREATGRARELVDAAETISGIPAIIKDLGSLDGDALQAVADALKGQFQGVILLGGTANGAVALVATVTPDFTSKIQAGKLIQAIGPIVGGKGGGRPDQARGGGKDPAKLGEALAHAKTLFA